MASASASRSLEVFAPRFDGGIEKLVARLSTVAQPSLVSVSGPPGGSALSLCSRLVEKGFKAQLHLTTELTPDAAASCIDGAVSVGVTHFFILDHLDAQSAPCSVLDLVSLVKSKSSSLNVAVCGSTEKADGAYARKLAAVVEQVQAGADAVIAGPVQDVEAFVAYERELRAAGAVACAVTPSVLPMHAFASRAELRRVARGLGLALPAALQEELAALPSEAALRVIGAARYATLHAELAHAAPTVHTLTLNSAAVIDSLRAIDKSSPASAPLLGDRGLVLTVLHSGELAAEIAQLVAQQNPDVIVVPMEDFREWEKEAQLRGGDRAAPLLLVCIVATIENEQAPEAAGRCVRFFNRNDHDSGMLRGVHVAVLGLGDSNLLLDRQTTTAKDCNAIAQRLEGNLMTLGASRLHTYGEADDRTNNVEIAPWLAALRPALEARRCALAGGGDCAVDDDAEGGGGAGDADAAAAAAEAKRIDDLAAMWL